MVRLVSPPTSVKFVVQAKLPVAPFVTSLSSARSLPAPAAVSVIAEETLVRSNRM